MSLNGEIRYMSHISQDNPVEFFKHVGKALNSGDYSGLYAEVQYSTVMQPDGKCIFSALILGRVREDTE